MGAGDFCGGCGQPLKPGTRFCGGCGRPAPVAPAGAPGASAGSWPIATPGSAPAPTGAAGASPFGRIGGSGAPATPTGAPAGAPFGGVQPGTAPTSGPPGADPPGVPTMAPGMPPPVVAGGMPPTGPGAPGTPAGYPSAAPRKGVDPKLLRLAGAVAAVVVVAVAAFVVLGGHGPGGDGPFADESGSAFVDQLQSAPSSEPTRKLWSKDCDGSCSNVIADAARLYVTSTNDGDTTVYAYARSDGDEVWHTSVEAADELLQVGDTLLASTYPHQFDAGDGVFEGTVALDTSDGSKRWHKDFSLTPFGSSSTLLLTETDGRDSTTHAVDARSGDEKWSRDGSPLAVCSGHALLEGNSDVSDSSETVDVSSHSYDVYGLSSGQKQNSIDADEDSNEATCSDDGVFVRNDEDVSAYSFTDRSRRWKTSVNGADGVSAGGGLVYVSRDGGIRALGASNGDERWSVRVTHDDGDFSTYALPMSGGRVLLSANGQEVLVKASDGNEVASHEDWPSVQKFCTDGSAIDAAGSSSDTGSSVDASGTDPVTCGQASSQGSSIQGMLETRGSSVRLVHWSDLDEAWSTDLSDVDSDAGISGIAVGGGQVYVVTDGEIQAYR